jgi:DNA-binding Lrp family transcriptional regulator
MLNKVLRLLEDDGRLTPEQIATMLGSETAEVKQLISQAEKDGLILKYKAVVNWDKIAEEQVWAIIEVRVTPQMKAGFDAIAERIYQFPEASTVMLVSGTYDLAIIVTARNMHEVASFVTHRLAPIEGVQGTTTHFLLKRYKEDGVVLDDKNKGMRQQVVL